MKNIAKKLAIFVTAVALVFSVFAFVACSDDDNNTNATSYTVKVVGPDGAPYTTALVQPCEVGAGGELTQCYNGVATDAQGVARLEIGKQVPNANADLLEIHLLNLPVYLTYTAPQIRRGDSVTIHLSLAAGANPASGTGVGVYDPISGSLDMDSSSPYVVMAGKAYKLKFTAADQKIYYAFQTNDEGVYKVYSAGTVDASVTMLMGTQMTGIHKPEAGDEDFFNDNVSATDKNFLFEFEVSPELIEQCAYAEGKGTVYFEVALENANDVNKDALICFEFVDEYQEEPDMPTVDVEPAHELTQLSGHEGFYIDYDYNDETLTYVKDAEGYYRVGDENGPVLYGTLGNDDVWPVGLGLSFMNIYAQGQSFSFKDGDVYKNYLPLVTAYSQAANDEGRYPVTDELIGFFAAYIANTNFVAWMEDFYLTLLPEGEEWLVWCGYYRVPSGDEDDPIPLEAGEYTVTLAAGEAKYYSLMKFVATEVEITSDSTNVSLDWYSVYDNENVTTVTSDTDGFACTIYAEANGAYCLVFSALNGQASSYTLTVTEESNEPDGSMDKPYIAEPGWNYGETTEMDGANVQPIYYLYTASEIDETLYFYVDESTVILSVQYVDNGGVTRNKSFAEIEAGLPAFEGMELTIEVATVDEPGNLSFAIYNAPLGSEDNPYFMTSGEIEIVVAAGATVYYRAFPYANTKFILTSEATNVKLTFYAQGDESKTVVTSTGTGFSYEVDLLEWTGYVFAFSTTDGAEATYTVTVEEEYAPEPEGSYSNPIVITSGGTYGTHVDSWFDEVFYSYTVSDNAETLSFSWDSTTKITVIINGKYYSSMDDADLDALMNGIEVEAGTFVMIQIGMADETGDGDIGFQMTVE